MRLGFFALVLVVTTANAFYATRVWIDAKKERTERVIYRKHCKAEPWTPECFNTYNGND